MRDQSQVKLSDLKKFNSVIVFIVCLIIGFFVSNALDYTFWSMGIQGIGVMGTLILTGIVLPIILIRNHKKTVTSTLQIIQATDAELLSYYNSLSLPLPIAYEYSNPRVLQNLIKIIESGRADSLKESINCMIDDQHKTELINLQKSAKSSADAAALFSLGTFLNTRK